MQSRPALFALTLSLAASVAGCGPAKLNEERSYSLPSGGAEVMDLPAISKPQKIQVEFTSSAADVTVYVIKDFKERDGLDLAPGKNQILASEKGKSGTITVDVPENTATRVVIRGASEDTKVTLKVTNSR